MSYATMDHAGWAERINAARNSTNAKRRGCKPAPETLSAFQAKVIDICGMVRASAPKLGMPEHQCLRENHGFSVGQFSRHQQVSQFVEGDFVDLDVFVLTIGTSSFGEVVGCDKRREIELNAFSRDWRKRPYVHHRLQRRETKPSLFHCFFADAKIGGGAIQVACDGFEQWRRSRIKEGRAWLADQKAYTPFPIVWQYGDRTAIVEQVALNARTIGHGHFQLIELIPAVIDARLFRNSSFRHSTEAYGGRRKQQQKFADFSIAKRSCSADPDEVRAA